MFFKQNFSLNLVPIRSIVLDIPKIADYFGILTHEKVKDFVITNFAECFKPIREAFF